MATPASSSSAARPLSQHPVLLLALWIFSAVLSWRLVAAYVASRLIGVDPAGVSSAGLWLTGAVLLPTTILTYRALRRMIVLRQTRGLAEEERSAALE